MFRWFPRKNAILLIVTALLLSVPSAFRLPARAQTIAGVGVPDDWSHHFLVFSTPTTPEQSYRVGGDSRYFDSRIRRSGNGSGASVAPAPARFPAPTPVAVSNNEGLWGQSISAGGSNWASIGPENFPAKFAFYDTTTINCGNAALPDYVAYGLQSGTISSQTGTFTGNPNNGQTITAGGNVVLTASASTSATGTITIANEPGYQDTVKVGATTYIWQPATATAATGTVTIATEPGYQDTVKVGTTTYIWQPATATAATGTVTIANEPSASDEVTVGTTTYVWKPSCTGVNLCVVMNATTSTDATNLKKAINGTCGGNACAANASVTATVSAGVVKLTASTTGTAGDFTLSLPVNSASNTVAGGNDGENGCPGVNDCVALASSVGTDATNLANAIGGTCGGNSCAANASATATSAGHVVTVTASTSGTAGDFTLSLPINTAANTVAGGNNGENGCPGVNDCVALSSTLNTDATNLKSAIGGTCGGNTCAANSSVTATSSGHVVTLTAATAGAGGDFALNLPVNTAANTISGGNNGADGSNTGTSFQTGVSTTADATNLAAAINRNGSAVGVTATSAASTVTVNSTVAGAIALAENMANFTWAANSIAGTLTGGSSSQATIIAWDNLYSSCSGTVPSVYWAYNTSTSAATSAQVITSPVLSLDGTQIAFVEKSGNTAYLVVLRWKTGEGTSAVSPVTPATQSTTGANYVTCKAGNGSCQLTLTLKDNDTNSSPFVDYAHDTLYVGDNSGKLHQVTGVFNGTPALDTTHAGWPVTVDSGTVLTSPVYDNGSSLVFVGDSAGKLSSVGTAANPAINTSGQIEYRTGGIAESPIVNSTTGLVYVFVSCDAACSATSKNAVFRFATGFTSGSGSEQALAVTGTTITNQIVPTGTFDNLYYSGSGNTGNLYACGYGAGLAPVLYRIPMSATWGSAAVSSANLAGGPGGCSPPTENLSGVANTDWLFLSVSANGNLTGCTGDCIYSFNVYSGSPVYSAGHQATAGASGIIIDNSASATGASQIYYSTQGVATTAAGYSCPSPSGGPGTAATAGGCAVQASQASLH